MLNRRLAVIPIFHFPARGSKSCSLKPPPVHPDVKNITHIQGSVCRLLPLTVNLDAMSDKGHPTGIVNI